MAALGGIDLEVPGMAEPEDAIERGADLRGRRAGRGTIVEDERGCFSDIERVRNRGRGGQGIPGDETGGDDGDKDSESE